MSRRIAFAILATAATLICAPAPADRECCDKSCRMPEVVDPPLPRNKLSVAFRLLLAFPHVIVLTFLLLAWWATTVVAWFVILFTGAYPQGLYGFGADCLGWLIRVEAYVLLLVDEYPPFALEDVTSPERPPNTV